MKKHVQMVGIVLSVILVTLACNATAKPVSTENPGLVNTQVAMAMTQTAMANPPAVPTSTPKIPNTDPGLVNTQVALAMTQTAMSIQPTNTNEPPALPTNTIEQPNQPPSADEIQKLIDSSNILVYEEMAGYPTYLPYVARALKSVGGHHEYVGDAMGTFMDQLNSGTKWDLIIMAAEARKAISGDYWTELKTQVDNKVALVAEVWYLDKIGGGKISPFLYECGVDVQADWQRVSGDDRLRFEMFWTDPNNPVFNTPNQVTRFAASLSDPTLVWYGDIGDLMKLRSGSTAKILASHASGQDQSSGLITSCFDGRVILQTFSSHDYPTNEMVALWQNYIVNTLTNHFLATH